MTKISWIIYGSKGWIGQMVFELIENHYKNDKVYCSEISVDDTEKLKSELNEVKPTHAISLFETDDVREQSGEIFFFENVRDNLYGPLSLAFLCRERGIHLSYVGTGNIFTGTKSADVSAVGFKEEDLPNNFVSSYSVVKGFTDRLMRFFEDSVLNVRICMPITYKSKDQPRNFISKIIRHKKICSVQNSMSALDELLPLMIGIARNRVVGTLNLANPGTISHIHILELYKEHVDPLFTFEKKFSPKDDPTKEDQQKILLNYNKLDTQRLEDICWGLFKYQVHPIEEAVIGTLKKWAAAGNAFKSENLTLLI